MATKTITSEPFKLNLPGATRPLNFKTETIFESDVNGNPVAGTQKTNLNYQVTPGGIFQTVATSTEGGKAGSWTLKNAANSNTPILGETAIRSLQTPNGVLNQETQKSIITTATKSGISKAYQKPLADKLGNTATTPSAENGTAPVNLQIEGTGKQSGFGNHVYPIDIGKSKQDKIKFSMLKYAPRQFQSTKGLGGLAERESIGKRILGSVILPVPSGISESNASGWGEDRLNPAEALAANIALTSMSKGLGAGADETSSALKSISENKSDAQAAIIGSIAEAATGVTGLLSRTQGAVINPNLELIFQGPSLRPFTFTFKMSARSDKEAKEIIKIIRFFKQGMSPQKSSSNLFIKTPHTFKIQYLFGRDNKDHPFIGQIKECALQNFVVNYTPEGQYATFYDGPMVSYEIQMTLQELEPVFNEDYGDNFPSNLLFKESK
jgi:hypothetical protein